MCGGWPHSPSGRPYCIKVITSVERSVEKADTLGFEVECFWACKPRKKHASDNDFSRKVGVLHVLGKSIAER